MESKFETIDIGMGLKLARTANKLSQAEAAKRVDITQNYLSLLENNHSTPSIQLLVAMSEMYGFKISFLLQDQG